MTAAKRKGTALESAARDYLAAFWAGRWGLKPYRPAQQGRGDTGDINGCSPFIAQCKSYTDVAAGLREGVDGAVRQADTARESFGFAILKRYRRPVEDAYAVMRLRDMARLIIRLRRAEALLLEHAGAAYLRHAAETEADLDRPLLTD